MSIAVEVQEKVAVLVGAVLVFLLAWASPADSTRADPGLALLVSQTMLEEGTGWIGEEVADAPGDHRVQVGGIYYNWGVPVLSLPAVWLALEAGYDMRRAADEEALQELLSALCCGLIFVLLWSLTRSFTAPGPAAVITGIVFFGSPLISTLATGLWNSAYATLLISAALWWLVKRPEDGLLVPLACAAVAGLCRPTAAFFVLGLGAYLLARRRWATSAAVFGALLTAALGIAWLGFDEVLYYYLPRKLWSHGADPLSGLWGVLASPGRGLFVYCPFVLLVWAAALRLWRRPLAVLVFAWSLSHLLAVASRPRWWGGHSFGPRYFTEIMPGVVLLAALWWSQTSRAPRRRPVRMTVVLFLVLGSVSVGLHSGVGLFNPWPERWNVEPDIDEHAELLWDWRFPPFLHDEARHDERWLELQRRGRGVYHLGERLEVEGDRAAWIGFSPPETGPGDAWRWTRRPRASVLLELDAAPSDGLCGIEIMAGARGAQRLSLKLGGVDLGDTRFEGATPRRRLFGFSCGQLQAGENEIAFLLPDARSTERDERLLGLSLRSLRLFAMQAGAPVEWRDDAYFGNGFSVAEEKWRWTDGPEAALWLPGSGGAGVIEIEAWSLRRQEVGLLVNGIHHGVTVLEPGEPRTLRWNLPEPVTSRPALLRLDLEISDPAPVPGDPRQLGLALIEARALSSETESSGTESSETEHD